MEYKTNGKEGTKAKGQKKESKLGKVNKRGNESECPGKDNRGKADDISNNFPNFSVLTQEERLAFFEALSAARKNIEKRGLPARERFGTVHDEYLQYFAQDDQAEAVEKKPESAPSVRPNYSPVAEHRSSKESKPSALESPKQKVPRNPKSVSPTPKKASKPPHKDPLRPESEPLDYCDSVIKRDTDKVIQIYLNKKKKIEEQWKKSSQVNKNPPAKATVQKSPKTGNKEAGRPESARAVSGAGAVPRAKTPSKAGADTPQFQALNPTERKEFFRILKEAHTNVLDRNPQKKNGILTLDEVLKPYRGGGGKVTTVCTATKNLHKQREQQKNLRVKVTLTSGDNERLGRTKSQILNDGGKEGSGGRSKSLENMLSADTVHGKQSKIPLLRKAVQEEDECSDYDHGTATVMKKADEDLKEAAPAGSESIKGVTEDRRKMEADDKEMKSKAKTKRRTVTQTKARKADQPSKKCDEDTPDANYKNIGLLKLKALNLEKRKAEFKRVQKEKERLLAEAARKDRELLKKKRKEDRIRRHQKKETLARKDANKDKECSCDCSLPNMKITGKKITEEECVEEAEVEHPQKKTESDVMQSQETDSNCTGTEEEADVAKRHKSKETVSTEEESMDQQASKESDADAANECEEKVEAKPAEAKAKAKSSESASCEDDTELKHERTFSSKMCSEQMVRTATQSKKSLAGVSLVEEKPGEVCQAREMEPTFTTGKVIVVDDNVIKRIKDLIQYLEKKVNPKDSLESEYVRLVLSYTEYLTKVTESLVRRNAKQGQQVHSTYAAHDVHLKFEGSDEMNSPKEEAKRGRMPRSISESDLRQRTMPAPSGIEKKEESRRKPSSADFPMLSDSESSSNSEEEYRTWAPSFKKTGIPITKIRLLQDLLKGRAKFVGGSIDDFKIVHLPEAEHVPPTQTPMEQAKELSEGDVDHVEKVIRKKFLRNLARLCNCGRKQIEEDAILENLKGEAVRVDAIDGKKNPASATINDDTMEVLKAAERKKIIQKYLRNDHS